MAGPGGCASCGASGVDRAVRLESRALRWAFRVYKTLLSPLVHAVSPTQCLYLPTCSEYAYVALTRFGVMRGSWLALRRLARCHPFAKGGLDPVPEREADSVPGREVQ